MKSGDLVKKDNGKACKPQFGLFLRLRESNGYVYSEILWFHGKVSGCQSNLLEKVV